MTKLIVLLTTTIGSAGGWWLGARVGIMTAFIVSMIGFALGLYYGKRFAKSVEI
jgi:hypothetical protein